ncbi:hypothetical protein H4R18_002914 [Coemansia javaensis]|uniref:L-2-hydroxyglutarate dehydrogenase, mitochondrial n=1 Tax=Coemansia javaensis TaxID=2761396 RepID=A0A9W8HAR2_9FUNG|nr:hypothetical protein H4R18_002914 [Coemansia javaensis]
MSARRLYTTAAERLAGWAAEDLACVDHLVIGGGVVGLAVGRQLAARPGRTTLVVEKNRHCGMETSSRNSEVIHAGIYYPRDSLRTRLCIEGKRLLYEYCERRRIPHRRTGKWVVAQDDAQTEYLHRLERHCAALGVPAHIIGRREIAAAEPLVRARAALASPTSGIVDSHALMAALRQDLADRGADCAPCAEVVALCRDHAAAGYRALVATGDAAAPLMAVRAATVVNAAGLWADRVASMLAPPGHAWHTQYKLHFAKGRYYTYASGTGPAVRRLVYPVPDRNVTTLGTHLTIDMAGAVRFGPDIEWVASNTDYTTAGGPPLDQAAAAIAEYLPGIRAADLVPDYAGIRPKLQPPGGAFRDFVVREESDAGFPGFVNLIGIESPGLTSSLAIAQLVDRLCQ